MILENKSASFITQDNDYIIELNRRKSIFKPNYFICNITIKNIFGNIIISLDLSDLDIVNIMDNIYAFFEFGGSVMYSASAYNQNMNQYTFEFSVEQSSLLSLFDGTKSPTRDIFTIYSYNNGIMTKVISINMADSLDYFVNLLYDTFFEDTDPNIKQDKLGIY